MVQCSATVPATCVRHCVTPPSIFHTKEVYKAQPFDAVLDTIVRDGYEQRRWEQQWVCSRCSYGSAPGPSILRGMPSLTHVLHRCLPLPQPVGAEAQRHLRAPHANCGHWPDRQGVRLLLPPGFALQCLTCTLGGIAQACCPPSVPFQLANLARVCLHCASSSCLPCLPQLPQGCPGAGPSLPSGAGFAQRRPADAE